MPVRPTEWVPPETLSWEWGRMDGDVDGEDGWCSGGGSVGG